MQQRPVSITGTTVAVGHALLRTFYGKLALFLYGLIAMGCGIVLYEHGGVTPLVVAIAVLLVPACVFHAFLEHIFVREHLATPSGGSPEEHLSFSIVRQLKHLQAVTVRDLLEAALATKGGKFIAREMGQESKAFLAAALTALEQSRQDAVEFLARAAAELPNVERKRIDGPTILFTLLRHEPAFHALLDGADLSMGNMLSILRWEAFRARVEERPPLWSPQGLLRSVGSVGRSWVMGYTNELDRLTEDLSADVLWHDRRAVRIHTTELSHALRIIEKPGVHDLLLIGRVGVGKRTLVRNLAYALKMQERKRFRAYSRMLLLKTAELLSGTQSPDVFLLHALKKAQQSGRFILVVEDLALFLQSGGERLRAILMKFLHEENIQLIGVMSTEEYHKTVRCEPILDAAFEKLLIDDANEQDTLGVLMERAFMLEHKRKVAVTYKALRGTIALCRRYLGGQAFPGKAVSVLEDAVELAATASDTFVTERHIREIISQKAHMDVTELSKDDRSRLLHLEEVLKHRIVGQKQAIDALVAALKRAALELHSSKRPIGTFLFLGPTGVGKTHTAKVLSEEYFGSLESLIRLDMNEYSSESSIGGIVGAPGESAGYLAQSVHDRPFSLILLDEIEKAHPKVLNLFLQILDEGVLIDHLGEKTDFRNTIFVVTSNAGAHFVYDAFRTGAPADPEGFRKRLIEQVLSERTFSPEFLNRFDATVVFNPLTVEDATRVAILMLDGIIKDIRREKGVRVLVEQGVVEAIVTKGYSREFGARAMRRVITDTIENHIADIMLQGNVKRGDEVVIRRDQLGF
ncbi:hypothetical protein COU80_00200 [Candidatus Peregrinibacteria bacterium CG10_big_fil_rev_8_21_14_0_10_55_24]|nr:MAG: hypothetical protein COU80_00200 [Candidatus Peregrinibacteria bacterium CG10_big_fil_rev_8_21_14_0_10_55_24]